MAFTFHLGLEGGGALLTEDERTILLYEFESETAIHYGLQVDWDGDGVLDNFNEAVYMIAPYTIDRGRERNIGAPGQGFEPYRVGTARITLDNSSGRYNPYNPDSELYGNLIPGRKMQFSEAHYFGNSESTDLFYGSTSQYVGVYGSNATYSTARNTYYGPFSDGGTIFVGQNINSTVYTVRRSFIRFDTSQIPDNAIIKSISISLTTKSVVGTTLSGNLQLVNINWSESDFSSTATFQNLYDRALSTDYETLDLFENYTVDTPISSNLSSVSRVNKNGYTTYALRSSEDFDATPPTTDSAYITIYGPESSGSDSYKPQITVTYVEPFKSYDIITGNITDIQPNGWNKTVTITAEDGIGYLKRSNISQIASTSYGTPALYLARIAALANYPYGTTADTSDPTTDFSMEYVYADGNALSEIEEMTVSKLGSFAAEGDGKLNYHSIYTTDTAIYTLTDDLLLNDPEINNPWEYLRSDIVIDATNLYKVPANSALTYTGVVSFLKFKDKKIQLDSGMSEVYELEQSLDDRTADAVGVYTSYDKTFGGLSTDATLTIFASTSSQVYSATDFTTPSTAISYSYLPGLHSSQITLTNNSTDTQYVYEIWCSTGEQFKKDKIEMLYGDSTSINSNNLFFVDSKYLYYQTRWFVTYFPGIGESKEFYYSDKINQPYQKNRLDTLGNLLYNYLSTSRPRFVVQIEGRPSLQFLMDVEKRVTYNSALLNINADYRIAGIRHTTLGNTQKVLTTLYLYPVIPSST